VRSFCWLLYSSTTFRCWIETGFFWSRLAFYYLLCLLAACRYSGLVEVIPEAAELVKAGLWLL
jgi:hypothetical protein